MDNAAIKTLLETSKTIAVVGLSDKPERASYQVADYMQRAGYTIIPVNPMLKDKEVLGVRAVGSLSEIDQPIDIVDIFRRAEEVGPVVDEAIEVGAKSVWMQLGIVNEEAGAKASGAGLGVIMDKCIKIEHLRLL